MDKQTFEQKNNTPLAEEVGVVSRGVQYTLDHPGQFNKTYPTTMTLIEHCLAGGLNQAGQMHPFHLNSGEQIQLSIRPSNFHQLPADVLTQGFFIGGTQLAKESLPLFLNALQSKFKTALTSLTYFVGQSPKGFLSGGLMGKSHQTHIQYEPENDTWWVYSEGLMSKLKQLDPNKPDTFLKALKQEYSTGIQVGKADLTCSPE